MSRLKYALIGYGRRGGAHIETAAVLKDTFEIVAICDAHRESAEAGATQFNVKACTDVRKMIDREKPEVCDVLVGFETGGERGTIVTNGNQSTSGGETVNVCTAEDITERAGQARTWRRYWQSILRRDKLVFKLMHLQIKLGLAHYSLGLLKIAPTL